MTMHNVITMDDAMTTNEIALAAASLERKRHSPKRPRLSRDCTPTGTGTGGGTGAGNVESLWNYGSDAWARSSMSLPRLATTMAMASAAAAAETSAHQVESLSDGSFTYLPLTPQIMSAGAVSGSCCFSDTVDYMPAAVDRNGGGGVYCLNQLAPGTSDSSSSASPTWVMGDSLLMDDQAQELENNSSSSNNMCSFTSAAAYHHDSTVHNESSNGNHIIINSSGSNNISNIHSSVISANNNLSQSRSHRFVMEAAQFVLRPDYLQYLTAEIPRWVRWGLWEQRQRQHSHTTVTSSLSSSLSSPSSPHLSLSSSSPSSPRPADSQGAIGDYPSLQAAYAAVCQLQTRMGDDSIRSRIALIELHKEYLSACDRGPDGGGGSSNGNHHHVHKEKHSVGRGELTSIIDHVMEGTYRDWLTLDAAQQKKRRAQFHDRKRYGRRWAILTNGLGEGIVFLASSKLTQIVRNTTVTYDALNLLVDQVLANPHLNWFLHQMNPLAKQLYHGSPCSTHLAAALLDNIRTLEQQGLECLSY